MTSIISSTRAPRRLYGTPHHSNSSGAQPIPTPKPNLLLVRLATEPTWRASRSGLREPSFITLVQNRSVDVTAPIAPAAISGSTHGVSSFHIRDPSGVYG